MYDKKVHSERYWSEASAEAAANRMRAKGYITRVRWGMTIDGRGGWFLEVFAD